MNKPVTAFDDGDESEPFFGTVGHWRPVLPAHIPRAGERSRVVPAWHRFQIPVEGSTRLRIQARGPDELVYELDGVDKLPGGSIEGVEESVSVSVNQGATFLAANLSVQQDTLVIAVIVPGVCRVYWKYHLRFPVSGSRAKTELV